eukprot:6211724-Pleurochrysis_carterae.AAC.1
MSACKRACVHAQSGWVRLQWTLLTLLAWHRADRVGGIAEDARPCLFVQILQGRNVGVEVDCAIHNLSTLLCAQVQKSFALLGQRSHRGGECFSPLLVQAGNVLTVLRHAECTLVLPDAKILDQFGLHLLGREPGLGRPGSTVQVFHLVGLA